MSIIEKALDKQMTGSETQAEKTQTVSTIEAAVKVTETEGVADIHKPAVNNELTTPAEPSKVVTLDLDDLERRHFVSLSANRRAINEEFSVIKRKLINNAFGQLSSSLKHPNLILVSSSRPGEGKTFTSVNLALSIALEQDKTVLLVDADVLRPQVAKTLGIETELGLTDYLSSDNVSVQDIILSTNVERLKVIPAGRAHHLSTELLASQKMAELVHEFATRYKDRIVLFDAPPLLGVNETAVVAMMCGQALIVIEENKSKLAEIEQSIALIPPEIAVGFVINKAHRTQASEYGYGYYYGGS